MHPSQTVALTTLPPKLPVLPPNSVLLVYPDGRVVVTKPQNRPAVVQPYEPKKNPCKACQG